jgi:putative aminopeptidase FrvX
MQKLPEIDQNYLLGFLTGLLNTPSPTGFAENAIDYTGEALNALNCLMLERTTKGALLATWPGESSTQPRALAAHADTLGAMVKEIKSDGRLRLTQIGGYPWTAIEGEGCTVFTSGGRQVQGSILVHQASSHVHGGKVVNEIKRSEDTMEVRLDVRTTSETETRALGIDVGDFIAFDPRVVVVENFIRSRHLDNKAGVACILTAVKAMQDASLKPHQKTYLFISNYEETGHGAASNLPDDISELLVVDMASVGDGQASDEYHASICVKDSSGPYHHGLSQRLRKLAADYHVPARVDIYNYYGSDGSSYWRAGGDAAVALIGPGIDASHSYERTHLDSLVATTQWLLAYLLNE